MCFCQCYTVQAQVFSPYESSLEDELQLQVGDIIRDIHINDGSYWTGHLNGRRGHFPKDHVKLLSEGKSYTLIAQLSKNNTNDRTWRIQYDY